MRHRTIAAALAAGLLAGAAPPALAQVSAPVPAQTAEPQAFQRLLDDHWAWWLKANPVNATMIGVRTYDRELGDLSLAGIDAETAQAKAFMARLDAIDPARLSSAQRIDHALLKRELTMQVEAGGFPQRTQLFNNRRGWHLRFANLSEQLPFFTRADYEAYLARLAAFPAYNRAAIATTREAIRLGVAHPCAAMAGFERTISAQVVDSPDKSSFMRPFQTRPATIPEADWTALRARAAETVMRDVVPAYREFLDVYAKEYAPRCHRGDGVADMPQGAAWYAHRVRLMTTTDMTPEQIHQLGLSEVKRILAEMDEVVRRSGFKGDRKAFVERLRTDPALYPKTPEELMAYAAVLAKQIDGEMPRLFGRLPRLPYTVKEVPAATAPGTTTAYYELGSLEAGRPGVYRVNTSKLDQRPLFEMPALTVHEAVPGHHQQLALQQELDLPMFRKYAVNFTAFSEGWGLYSERLGIEMGLYDTPEKDFGRLSYEMWRACRLVVDTGLHSKGWTREQAIRFMLDNTALSRGNIEAEVNRYMVGPGQALAYKLGELKIRSLRARAEKELGANFDLRAFHDAVLENGEVPLDVLETHVSAWIEKRKAARVAAAH